ncbi:STAS domain-containing protein [candidate division KSB1 bacterium]|nr:STAS domain-containing protein [candidate division KSB1 bacterium]NIR70535.1 STAS domain-containing protein [candidate division KSB1 bacterium]NIS26207.1 STAS domain-containing protein [candidate division KSB1 bacterium]NIT72986.1 STAS domain-containing protein [candidate division KSB1 bacterium]NIU26855.1 STAS domain-containing protein [candidate division KSB1 bacterium]
MKLHEEKISDVLVVRLEEPRLDNTVSSEFKTELLRLAETEGVQNVLVDLGKVDYADSSGLGALLFGHRQLKLNSGDLKLLNPTPKVQTLIRIAKLEDVLAVFDNENAAVESFRD